MLEISQYLENYLWPNFTDNASHAHVMSIVYVLNEKFREKIEVWKVFETNEEQFPIFFNKALQKCLETRENPSVGHMREQTALIVFLNHCFGSMEVEICREQAKKLVSLAMWSCLQPSECYLCELIHFYYLNVLLTISERRDEELSSIPEWKKFWKKLQKREKAETKGQLDWERHFLQVFY